jgi:hypothetical protein
MRAIASSMNIFRRPGTFDEVASSCPSNPPAKWMSPKADTDREKARRYREIQIRKP